MDKKKKKLNNPNESLRLTVHPLQNPPRPPASPTPPFLSSQDAGLSPEGTAALPAGDWPVVRTRLPLALETQEATSALHRRFQPLVFPSSCGARLPPLQLFGPRLSVFLLFTAASWPSVSTRAARPTPGPFGSLDRRLPPEESVPLRLRRAPLCAGFRSCHNPQNAHEFETSGQDGGVE